jgi:DNA adenine methylase
VRHGLPVWDAFCGGLSISSALHTAGSVGVISSDIQPGLIALYRQLAVGDWSATADCDAGEYEAAKRLPDDSPRKAFIAFGCSFGGKYFAGYAKQNPTHPRGYADEARALLRKKIAQHTWTLECWSFFDVPVQAGLCLYLDPPYRGTTGYAMKFDFDAFDRRVAEWAAKCPVYVSEYSFPLGRSVWSRASTTTLGAGVQGGVARTEHLFALGA